MIALKVIDRKEFMNLFLRTELFDHFLLSEAVITTYMTFQMEGHTHPDFFSHEDEGYAAVKGEDFVPFAMVRSTCFQLMKGKRTPAAFKFVFLLSKENQAKTLASLQSNFTPEDISGMFVNLKYQEGQIVITTGISYRTFSMDKTLEQGWDEMVRRFFKSRRIACEPLV